MSPSRDAVLPAWGWGWGYSGNSKGVTPTYPAANTDSMSISEITTTNTSYSYKGVPLTPGIAQVLIRKLFTEKLLERQVIVDEVLRAHLAGGGLKASAQDLSATFKRALAAMRENGSAENSSI